MWESFYKDLMQRNNWDIFVIISFVILFLFFVFWGGYSKLLTNTISIYITTALIKEVPIIYSSVHQIDKIQGLSYSSKIFISGLFVVGIFMAISWGLAFLGRGAASSTSFFSGWWKNLILAFFQAGLAASIILNYLDPLLASYVSWSIREFFIGEIVRILWFILPLIVLIIIGKLFNNSAIAHKRHG